MRQGDYRLAVSSSRWSQIGRRWESECLASLDDWDLSSGGRSGADACLAKAQVQVQVQVGRPLADDANNLWVTRSGEGGGLPKLAGSSSIILLGR